MAKEKYRAAVVGGAGMWGRHYLKAFAEHPECEIIGLVDRNRERRREFAQHYGVTTEYDDIEDLFAREIPDVVSAILPVAHTCDVVIACAEAGVKAVSCEKPIAAELHRADEAVRICRERGTALGCGTAYWEVPFIQETAAWIHQGHIGTLTGAAIPGGLPREMSGGGCVQLTMMRLLTGMEVEWVEGWTLPPEADKGWVPPAGVDESELDRPGYGRLGLSGGIVCEIPEPRSEGQVRCRVSATGENGQVWANSPQPVLIQGVGASSTPVYPDFFDTPRQGRSMSASVERLLRALDNGDAEVVCSGHDYRQALEIAIALNLSAQRDHERVHLPLEDRSLRLFPHPYRMQGGDVAGYESIGYESPPEVDKRVRRKKDGQ